MSHVALSGDRACQAEGKASAKVLRQKQAWYVQIREGGWCGSSGARKGRSRNKSEWNGKPEGSRATLSTWPAQWL